MSTPQRHDFLFYLDAPKVDRLEDAPRLTGRRQPYPDDFSPAESFWNIVEITDHKGYYGNLGCMGYAVGLHICSLKNIENYKSTAVRHGAKWVLLEDSWGRPQIVRLLLDTGCRDSWTFSDVKKEQYMTDNSPTRPHNTKWSECGFDAARLYENKPTFPRPPPDMMDDDQRTEITYGIVEASGSLYAAQTICMLRVPNKQDVQIAGFPIAVALSSDPEILWRFDHGVLGLGPGQYSSSQFGRNVRWKSKSPQFWISFGHPDHDRNVTFIVFGSFYHPSPWADNLLESNFTHVPLDDGTSTGGLWTLKLLSIIIQHADESVDEQPFDVGGTVVVDSAASQSYLPARTAFDINDYLSGVQLTPRDQVVLVFGDSGHGEIRIKGQAQRFFNSPLPASDIPDTNMGTSGTVFILGVNLFRTFIVGFHEGAASSISFFPQRFTEPLR
ncbi:hypothetical protein AURDEDRAFT_127350 [Auricularia subglabra TFB-10046 SS5]|uniref:Acid protease n=1 Tax=Auricularia subglabra (strain TFB-10046 / SS5) TaxID=717982 RepID=J0LJZ9_AURST|nr:hypothetical protein AURDEDRAFT_127350 [Auricularia subglabra TFB-10046 SS5]